jgi:small basic protein
MFLLLLALLIGLVLGQFIKIELPGVSKQVLISTIKSILGTAKAVFDRLMQELHQPQQLIEPLTSLNGEQSTQDSIKAVIKGK